MLFERRCWNFDAVIILKFQMNGTGRAEMPVGSVSAIKKKFENGFSLRKRKMGMAEYEYEL